MKKEKITQIKLELVDYIPVDREYGILYLSKEYKVSVHECPCGCGKSVHLDHTRWDYLIDGDKITIRPSVGSFNLVCNSHYFITENNIDWL